MDIFHAGRDAYGNAVPALEVVGQPPVMYELNVKYSAFDAINIYKPVDAFALEKSVISDNRGKMLFSVSLCDF